MDPSALDAVPRWYFEELGHVGWRTMDWFDVTEVGEGSYRRNASREHWLLLVVGRGQALIRQRGCEHELRAGDALVLPAGTSHHQQTAAPCLLGRFPLLLISERRLAQHPLQPVADAGVVPLADATAATHLLNKAAALSDRPQRDPGSRLQGSVIAQELLLNAIGGAFSAGILPHQRPGTADWLLQARRLLMERYHNPTVDIPQIADAVGRSRSELQRRFAEAFGTPPKEWLHRYRIGIAARLLANNPDMTVASLMQRCGYASRSQFYRMFKRYRNTSPGSVHGR